MQRISQIEKLTYMRSGDDAFFKSQIHSTYVEYILNPFNAKQGCIKSRRFQQQMDQIASM